DFPAPAILTGVSGSGKSCTLLHRAKRLAQLYRERVLIVTLNPSLADLLRTMFQRLPDSAGLRVEVFSYYDYVAALLTHTGLDGVLRLLNCFADVSHAIEQFRSRFTATALGQLLQCRNEVQLRDTWDEFTTSSLPEQSRWNEMSRLEVFLHSQQPNLDAASYIREEFDLIRSGFRIRDGYRGYIEGYPRTGRSIALQENRRQPVLNLLKEWEKWQLAKGVQDQMGLTQLATLVVEDAGELPRQLRYRAVLVDEFQDFSTLDLALLSQVPTRPENGLFLTGDFAQKVFPKEMSVSAVLGQNRSRRRITKNYRNTQQILESGTLLLQAYPIPADADPESHVLRPEYAEREGPRPFVCQTVDPVAAAWAYVADRLDAGYSAFSVCIATAAPKLMSVETILNQTPANLKAAQLTGSYILDTEIVVVSELADIKGFEFGLVIVVGVEDGVFPDLRSAEGERWRDALRLYVAMTRARDELRLIYRSSPSPFLTAMWTTLSPLMVEIETRVSATDDAGRISPPDSEAVADATVLNGRTVVKIPYEPTQDDLARALGTTPVQIANYAYPLGVFPTAITRFAEHNVLAIFEKFDVIPMFVRPAQRVDTTGRVSRFRAPRPTVKNEIPAHRCQQCGRPAIPGDSICYSCS
ncbi:MAG: AAA family ATPase, partial [Blastocatellia bacterium]|nr:AAA family ATPase [Blastocatellia bacterium]